MRRARTAISATIARNDLLGSGRRTTRWTAAEQALHPGGVGQFHFDPATYMELMRTEVPSYPRLQEEVVRATAGVAVAAVLDLGTGTGETLAAVLARHPGAAAHRHRRERRHAGRGQGPPGRS